MNTIEIISTLSEESILAIVAFLGAGAFYMLRLTKIMRSRIREFEERELSGRDSFKKDVDLLQGIQRQVQSSYQHAEQQIEGELVEYELAAFALNPRLKLLNTKIENAGRSEGAKFANLREKMGQVSQMTMTRGAEQNGLSNVRTVLPQTIQIVKQMQLSMQEQHSKIEEMNGDIRLIKMANGVE